MDTSPPTLPPSPQIGQSITVHGCECTIDRIPSYGVIEASEIDGPGAWRLQGLAWRID